MPFIYANSSLKRSSATAFQEPLSSNPSKKRKADTVGINILSGNGNSNAAPFSPSLRKLQSAKKRLFIDTTQSSSLNESEHINNILTQYISTNSKQGKRQM